MYGKNIIFVGLQSWDIEIGSNCKNIAMELAKNNQVLYVNRALDFASILNRDNDKMTKNRWGNYWNKGNDLLKVESNLWCLSPKIILFSINMLPSFLFQFFNRINNQKIAKCILEAAKKLEFKEYILFIDNDFIRAQYLAEFIFPEASIYYIRDYLINQPYFQKHGAKAEKQIIEKSDLIVANSDYLTRYASVYNQNTFFIGQGCDYSYFDNAHEFQTPKEFEGLNSPIIGYVGALTSKRLDIELITGLAQAFPQCYIMLVGPEDEIFKKSTLHFYKNVIFTGTKTLLELPLFINKFDICINPQLVNDLTMGNYPRKIDEYLILGKPVIATSTEFMKYFGNHVFICKELPNYIDVIRNLLQNKEASGIKEERIAFARSHSWDNSVKLLSEKYNQVVGTKNKN